MGTPWFFCSFRLLVALFSIRTGCHEYLPTVHVSLFGQDTTECGSIKEPCRTISVAVTRVDWGGHVVLNGSGTEERPYDCKRINTHVYHPGIRVSRNVTITSLNQTQAHETCQNGFHFHRSKEELRITLRGVTLLNTPLEFKDCSDVEIFDCAHLDTHTAGAVSIRMEESWKVNVTIRNSVFQNNSVGLEVDHLKPDVEFSLNIDKTKFLENGFYMASLERGAVWLVSYDKLAINKSNFATLDVKINKCTFRNNLIDLYGLLNNTVDVRFRITNSLFDGRKIQRKDSENTADNSTYGIRVIIPPESDKRVLTRVNITIENVTFVGRPANAFVLVAKGNKSVNVRGCKFRDSFSLEKIERRMALKYKNVPGYITGQGVFLFLFNSDKLVHGGCVKPEEDRNIHPIWNYTSRVLFEDSVFQNNSGRVAGAIQIINGYVKFRRCNFTNNFAARDTGHVYLGYGSTKAEFESCIFKRTKREVKYEGTTFSVGRFVHSESGGPINIKNTSFVDSFSQRLVPQPILRISFPGVTLIWI